MSQFTDYAENKMANHLFRDTAWTAPTSLWFGLCTSNGSDGFTDSTQGYEVNMSGTGYACVEVTCDTGHWSAPSFRYIANSNDIVFPTATSYWNTIYKVGIFDAATGGNLLFYSDTYVDEYIEPGKRMTLEAGSVSIFFNGKFSDYLGDAMLNHVFRGISFSSLGTLYASLHPSSGVSSSGISSEVSGGSYARVAVATTDAAWSAPSDGVISNASAIVFPTATGSWGTIGQAALSDASSGGNLITYSTIAALPSIVSTNTPTFPIGDFKISVT